jgi:hypothetical protein
VVFNFQLVRKLLVFSFESKTFKQKTSKVFSTEETFSNFFVNFRAPGKVKICHGANRTFLYYVDKVAKF